MTQKRTRIAPYIDIRPAAELQAPPLQPLSFWNARNHWPRSTLSRVFLCDAILRLGRAKLGEHWDGQESSERQQVATVIIDACSDGKVDSFVMEPNGPLAYIEPADWLREGGAFIDQGGVERRNPNGRGLLAIYLDGDGLERLIKHLSHGLSPGDGDLAKDHPLCNRALTTGAWLISPEAQAEAEKALLRRGEALTEANIRKELQAILRVHNRNYEKKSIDAARRRHGHKTRD